MAQYTISRIFPPSNEEEPLTVYSIRVTPLMTYAPKVGPTLLIFNVCPRSYPSFWLRSSRFLPDFVIELCSGVRSHTGLNHRLRRSSRRTKRRTALPISTSIHVPILVFGYVSIRFLSGSVIELRYEPSTTPELKAPQMEDRAPDFQRLPALPSWFLATFLSDSSLVPSSNSAQESEAIPYGTIGYAGA
ncbi:hypothetical protein GYMLUDRAFT_990427 [Collybiopsis luxurians FD-317 M1]|uniref:Uncharacterized protein n=1 Tax=Collybiopsis luxurians FD-317 M1 TaxID=944289 RepID=A0A0D0CTU4_9AGAR|nr:hypothetical protein GYMLUDRAFT_990427 [Collybiopsis luxurians FD-317 M1]